MPALSKALMTAIYPVPDIAAAKAWYAAAFGVENADEAWKRLALAGAKPLDSVKDVGGGIRVAVVTDSYGNVIGLIENPHFTGRS